MIPVCGSAEEQQKIGCLRSAVATDLLCWYMKCLGDETFINHHFDRLFPSVIRRGASISL